MVEREASQGEHDIKRMHVKVESLQKRMELTGWSEEKEHMSVEALCKAKDNAM